MRKILRHRNHGYSLPTSKYQTIFIVRSINNITTFSLNPTICCTANSYGIVLLFVLNAINRSVSIVDVHSRSSTKYFQLSFYTIKNNDHTVVHWGFIRHIFTLSVHAKKLDALTNKSNFIGVWLDKIVKK